MGDSVTGSPSGESGVLSSSTPDEAPRRIVVVGNHGVACYTTPHLHKIILTLGSTCKERAMSAATSLGHGAKAQLDEVPESALMERQVQLVSEPEAPGRPVAALPNNFQNGVLQAASTRFCWS